jgi:uncharacterized protein YbjT (DUF2867 family)
MKILVTGATGNVGRHVVRGLVERGADVRALTRHVTAARFPAGVDVVEGDLSAPESLAAAFAGIDRLFLFPLAYLRPTPRGFDDVVDTQAVVAVAQAAGVERIVTMTSDDGFRELELAVEATGSEWTHVRPGEFMANRLDMWAHTIRTDDTVRTAHPEARGVPVHEADIADVAVTALLDDGHSGVAYHVTGPEALTLREQAAAIATGVGRPLRFVELTPAEATAQMREQGILEEVIETEFVGGLAAQVGTFPTPAATVEQVTGHPGRTMVHWAADHRADFAR